MFGGDLLSALRADDRPMAERAVALVEALDGTGIDPASPTLLLDMLNAKAEFPAVAGYLDGVQAMKDGDLERVKSHLHEMTAPVRDLLGLTPSVWSEFNLLVDMVRSGRVTVLLGTSGAGKTETCRVLTAAARREGRGVHVVPEADMAAPKVEGEIMDRLRDTIAKAQHGDLVVACGGVDDINLTALPVVAHEAGVTVVVEMNGGSPISEFVGQDVDLVVMRQTEDAEALKAQLPGVGERFVRRMHEMPEGQGLLVQPGCEPVLFQSRMVAPETEAVA